MTDKKFQTGDVVALVSGGPAMTVKRVNDARAGYPADVHVEWFDTVGHLQDAYFDPDMLDFEQDDSEPQKERAS